MAEQANADLITRFYTAFQELKGDEMAAMYADNATFSDPAFVGLKGKQPGLMWKMLTTRAKEFKLTFKNVKGTANGGSADWIATYLYGGNRKVENHIHAEFKIVDGKIVEHVDKFDFYKWSKQALGVPGLLLGWTSFLQSKVQGKARAQLDKYIEKHGQ
jgi:hypothetical protein